MIKSKDFRLRWLKHDLRREEAEAVRLLKKIYIEEKKRIRKIIKLYEVKRIQKNEISGSLRLDWSAPNREDVTFNLIL